MASEEHLEIMRSKASVIITLSRPQVLNAITLEMPLRLDEIFDAFPSDLSVRAIVQHPLSDGLAYEAAATYEISGTTDCVARFPWPPTPSERVQTTIVLGWNREPMLTRSDLELSTSSEKGGSHA
jgi:hypothetical protein